MSRSQRLVHAGGLLAVLLLAACLPVKQQQADGGQLDAGRIDAGAVDAGDLDAGPVDAGDLDAGPGDAGVPDAGQAGPCATNNGGCDPNATCSADSLQVACTCNDGFTGDGRSCLSTSGAVQLSKSTSYRFAWPAVGDAALVATLDPSGATSGLWTGELHLVRKGSYDVRLNNSGPVALGSVEVDLTGPTPSAVWLEGVDSSSGVGQAFFLDLSQPTPTPKMLSGNAFNIIHAGVGNQLLIVGDVTQPGSQTYGSLRWSDGNMVSPIIGGAGAGALVNSIAVSADKSLAVVGVNVQNGTMPGDLIGDLWAVNLKNGQATQLATGALVANFTESKSPLFALSQNGKAVAYVDQSQAVSVVSTTGGQATLITSNGAVPAISADGALVAYTAGTSAYVSPVVNPAPVVVGSFTALSQIAAQPVFTPDGKGVLYYSKISEHSGLIGTAYLASTTGAPSSLRVGVDVAITSTLQDPRYQPLVVSPNTCGYDLLVNASLHGIGGFQFGTPDWFGIGELTWVSISSCPGGSTKATVLQSTNGGMPAPLAVSTHDMSVLSDGSAAVFTGDYAFAGANPVAGADAAGDLFVVPFASLGNGPFTPVAAHVQQGSVVAVPGNARALFAQNATASIVDGNAYQATLAAVDATGKVTPLASGAFSWIDPTVGVLAVPVTSDGRAVVVLPAASESLSAGVWLMPIP